MATRAGPTVRAKRIVVAVSAAMGSALVSWMFWSAPRVLPSDIGQAWAGARALLDGLNPYDAVGPGRQFPWNFPLLYPMTAVLPLIPLAPLPLRVVDPLFVGLGAGMFAWAVTRQRPVAPALVALVSVPGLMVAQTSQWSLLLTGAAMLPAFGWLLIAKPTIGMALFVAYPHWKTAAGCIALLAVSLVARPGWVAEWTATFASAPHVVAPVTRPGGALVLLALLRWKRPEARLLVAMACVPHTTAFYETIPLFLIPRTWPEAWCLWVLELLAFAGQRLAGPYPSQAAFWASGAQWIVALIYLPSLLLVLSRPNLPCDSDTRS